MSAEPAWEDVELQEVPRDRWNRPLILPPGGGARRPFRRPSQEGKVLEDLYSLSKWEQRMTAAGIAARPDLLLQVSSLGLEPPKIIKGPLGDWIDNPRYPAWRASMDEACLAAKEAAHASSRRTVGSALHKLCENFDRGEEMPIIPEQYLVHIASYAAATDGWQWIAIERFMVCDEQELAGSPDRVGKVPGYPRPLVIDIKTGDQTYGAHSRSIQLAAYAHSVFYEEGRRIEPPEPIETEFGLIVAVDAITGETKINRIDLRVGWEALKLAKQVRAWRAHKGLEEPWRASAPPALQPAALPAPERPERPRAPLWAGQRGPLHVNADIALFGAIANAASSAELTEIWQSVDPSAWTAEHTRAAAERKQILNARNDGQEVSRA